jgi:outer membrane protein assembly factor BamB
VSLGGVHVVRRQCLLTTVDAGTGAERWSATTTTFAAQSCGQFVQVTSGDPYVIGDDVYVGAVARAPSVGVCNGFTRGFDQATGAVVSDTANGALEAFRPIDRFELVGDHVAGTTCRGDGAGGFRLSGTINLLGEAGRDVFVAGGLPHATFGAAGDLFQAGPGLLTNQPGDSPTGAPVAATPALAPRAGSSSDLLYVPTADGRIVAVDTTREEVVWEGVTGTGSAIGVQPTVAGGLVFTGSADGTLHAFPAAGWGAPTCAPVWSATTGSEITGAPAVSGGRLYVGTADGRLIAYGLA